MHEQIKDGLRYVPGRRVITAAPYTLASIAYPGNDIQDTMGGFGNFQIRQESVQSYYANQAQFPETLAVSTAYGGAFRALEDIGATYVMGGITLDRLADRRPP